MDGKKYLWPVIFLNSSWIYSRPQLLIIIALSISLTLIYASLLSLRLMFFINSLHNCYPAANIIHDIASANTLCCPCKWDCYLLISFFRSLMETLILVFVSRWMRLWGTRGAFVSKADEFVYELIYSGTPI